MPGSASIKVLPTEKIDAALSALDQWSVANGALTRSFTFINFSQAFAFMTRVALLAEKADHHPDWSNSYNRVDIALVTHAKGGITQKDLDLAKAIDRL